MNIESELCGNNHDYDGNNKNENGSIDKLNDTVGCNVSIKQRLLTDIINMVILSNEKFFKRGKATNYMGEYD